MSRLLRYSTGLLVGLLCAIVFAITVHFGWLSGLEGSALDAMFRARGQNWPDPRVTILVADDASVAQIGQWPLPRETYAKVVRKLDRAGAKTIVLDILFSVPSYSPKADAEFAQACKESGKVVQAAVFHIPLLYNSALPASLTADKRTPPTRFAVTDQGVHCRNATWVSSALPELQASAPALGHINVYPETDGILRRTPLIRYRDRVYPSLALAAASHFLGVKPRDVVARRGETLLATPDEGTRRIPLDENGEALVNWTGGNQTFPTYNFLQLLNGEVPEVALKDRLVLVGVTAAGAFEHRATPFSPVQPAIELQANAVNDILRNEPVEEAPLLGQTLLLLVFPMVVGVLVAPGRALGGMLWMLLLDVLLWRGAVWALGSTSLYVPVAAPLLAGLATYSLLTAFNLRREWEANWRVDAAVTALARGGALMSSGREREALLAVIRRTAREVLRARHVFLVLEESSPNGEEKRPRLRADARYPSLALAAERILKSGSVVLWPGKALRLRRDPTPMPVEGAASDQQLNEIMNHLNTEVREAHGRLRVRARRAYNSILAAPLPLGIGNAEETIEGRPQLNGVLVAAGRRDGQAFSERDAILLETLAEQAALALENLEYYEVLQGRVELANRNLRAAYQILTEERAKLAAAIESNESALIITDQKHQAVFINTATAGVLLEATPASGQCVPEVLRSRGMEEFAELFDQIRATNGQEKLTREMVRLVDHHLHSGPVRNILSAQLTPLSSDEEGSLGAMLVVTDITAQRELEQMKDDFVSYVAHELVSPLSTINGYAYLLRTMEMEFDPEQRQEMFHGIEYQCERLNRMVTDLLDISRLEPQPRIPLHRTEVDLAALGEQVIQSQRAALPDPRVHTLELRTPPAPVIAEVDADRMEQIFINLLSNAVKYSPEGGKVTLDLSTEGQNGHTEVVVKVRDQGMGMTPDQVARVFQKYYRSPEAQSRGIKGTGLGLHLTKRLVEAHGGDIEVESELGHGTIITLRVPAEAPLDWGSEELED